MSSALQMHSPGYYFPPSLQHLPEPIANLWGVCCPKMHEQDAASQTGLLYALMTAVETLRCSVHTHACNVLHLIKHVIEACNITCEHFGKAKLA